MTSKLTRERIQRIIRAIDSESYDEEEIREWLSSDEIMELARMALAAMDNETVRNPVLAYADSYRDMAKQGVESVPIWSVITDLERNIAPLYRHAQPAPVVVPDGLRLALSNAGIAAPESDEMLAAVCGQYIQLLVTWVKDRKPFQPAPVVPEEMTPQQASRSYGGEVRGYRDGWNACRAAMLQAQPSDDGEPTDDERIMDIEGIHNCERCGDEGWVVGEMGITRCACGQAGNSPVIGIDPASGPDRTVEVRYIAPPGYVMVPKEPTERMVIDGFESEPDETFSESEVWEAYQKMSGCEQAAFRARLCWAAMLAAVPPAPTQENI